MGNLQDKKINFDLNSKEIKKWPELERFMLHQIFVLNSKFYKHFVEYNFHKLYRELLNFCSLELSAFYFDIRKDVLYCDEINSTKRLAMYKFVVYNIGYAIKMVCSDIIFYDRRNFSNFK